MTSIQSSSAVPSIRDMGPMKFTSFDPYQFLNAKNVSSGFNKYDSQSWQSHRPTPLPLPQDTIVLHPGSRSLKIGRASDMYPCIFPSVLARYNGRSTAHAHTPRIPDDSPAFDAAEQVARQDLRARMRAFRIRATPSAGQNAVNSNRDLGEAGPEVVSEMNDPYAVEWVKREGRNVLFCEEALKLEKTDGWQFRWPFGSTGFTDDESLYDSPRALLRDVEDLLAHSIKQLGIEKAAFKTLSCILVVPDNYSHNFVNEMCNLFLKDWQFNNIILQQESLCTTFGAGMSSACVVDIGAKSTTIACVEEGMIIPESRLHLAMGGDDITEVFFKLLMKAELPYIEADLTKSYDWKLIEDLKERTITLHEGGFGLNLFEFTSRRPGKPTGKFKVRLYDEVMMAPLCLFFPRILPFTTRPASKLWPVGKEELDIGGDAITAASQMAAPAEPIKLTITIPAINAEGGIASGVNSPRQPSMLSAEDGGATRPTSPTPQEQSTQVDTTDTHRALMHEASKLPLDVSIAHSLFACVTEERVRRFSSNIIISGGGGNIIGLNHALETRLLASLAARYGTMDKVSVLPMPRGTDPRVVVWKGVSQLCRLDCVSEMWIGRRDWDMMGLRAVRDKCCFMH